MDIVVIGKASHNNGDKPQVVYCGSCRVEAEQAVAKSNLVRFYEIDAHRITRPIAKATPIVSQPIPPVAETETASTVLPESKTESQKKSKSK